jgi:hypothetical protein
VRARRAWALVAAAVALVACALPASANDQRTFGADLAVLAPQSRLTCDDLYEAASCTVLTSGASLGRSEDSFLTPQGPGSRGLGTITAFHLRVGNSTGQMQILLLQALRRRPPAPQEAECCVVIDATRAFTPRADATTTVSVNWTTESDRVPNPDNGIFAFDVMAVSVGAGVALPIAPYEGAVDGFFAPACPARYDYECFREGGDERYIVTMNATWVPSG